QHILAHIVRVHAELVTAGGTLDETLAQLARGACILADTPLDRGLIRVIDPDTSLQRQDVRSNGSVLRSRPMGQLNKRGVIRRAINERQTQIVADVSRDRDYIQVDDRVRSEIAVPLLASGRCWGVLNLESYQPDYFTPDLVPWIEILANQALVTIQADMFR